MFVNAYSGRQVLHASHHPPVPKGQGTYSALCGRTVRNVTTTEWDPRGAGGRCAECVNETIRRDR